MRHLAIECSGFGGSVSMFEDELELARLSLSNDLGSVRSLAPAIKNLISAGGSTSASPPAFLSVTTGPGSFTGLRVGLATAKMLAFAWKIPVVGIDTLESIALRFARFDCRATDTLVVPVINAFRKQVFAAAWSIDRGLLFPCKPTQVIDAQVWQLAPCESLTGFSQEDRSLQYTKMIVTGPGLREYKIADSHSGTAAFLTSPDSVWDPSSTEVGLLGLAKFLRGAASTAESLSANYVRLSAAEELRRQS